jgi:hypothetical protein
MVEGAYTFRLTATDNRGAARTDDVIVNVSASVQGKPLNTPPVANAGTDKILTLPANSVSITGSGTDTDGTIATYAWTKISGGSATLANANTNRVTLSGLVAGSYVFRLTVTDDAGATHYDDVSVIVNIAPVASAGPDKQMTLPANSYTIQGSGTDSDGTISTYAWTKISGGDATLTNANTSRVSFSGLDAGVYVFRLTVTDNRGATHYDEVNVVVNIAPVANAGPDKNATTNSGSTTLTGSGTDSDGSIVSYAWTKISGGTATLSGAGTATLSLSSLVQGTYRFGLTVTDNRGATGYDEVVVSVAPNVAPSSFAGPDREIALPTNSIAIAGSAEDIDGTIETYIWSKWSGGAATLTNTDQPTLNVSGLVAGTYVFRLRVIDNDGASDSNDMILTVESNEAPVVNAGIDQLIKLPATTATIVGTASDVDGTITSYSWTKLFGGSATLGGASTSTLTLSGLVAGNYIFRLTAADNAGAISTDDVVVTVATNLAPSSNAGVDRSITLPTSSISIPGSGEDPDGTIVRYIWSKWSGGSAILSNTDKPTLSVSGLAAGTYVFRLRVVDNDGASDSNDMILTVNASGSSSGRLAFDEESLEIPASEETVDDDFLHYSNSAWKNKYVVMFDSNGNRIHQGEWTREASETLAGKKGLFIYHILREGKPVRQGKVYLTDMK